MYAATTKDEGNAADGYFSASCLIGRNRHNWGSPFFSGLYQSEDKHQEGKDLLGHQVLVVDPEVDPSIGN
jgi:hypothetical protein